MKWNHPPVKKVLMWVYWVMVYGFALVGFVFVGMFFAIRLKLTDVNGSVDEMSDTFQTKVEEFNKINEVVNLASDSGEMADLNSKINQLTNERDLKIKNLCALEELSYSAPKNVEKILAAKDKKVSDLTISGMIFAAETYLNDSESFDKNVESCMTNFSLNTLSEEGIKTRVAATEGKNIFIWPDTEEWQTVSDSVLKDRDAINRAAATVDLDPRLIVSDLVVEQLRVYYSARELYKKYFEPLKILSNMNKMSLGVMAIKEETAIQIENHLKDKSSPYYLGQAYENLLGYSNGQNMATERYNRLTDNKHYYSYLYAAVYLKQMMVQWKNAGFDIGNRPEIIGTLFNVGFSQSKPNASPKIGGSSVTIGGNKYSFGRLSYEFFYSGELMEAFPYLK